MVVKIRKKVRRFRGSRNHGYGPNKHRGTGQKGGAGRAGSGKKCDAKKTRIWGTKKDYFGSSGFVSRYHDEVFESINLRDLQDRLDAWLERGLVSKEGDVFVVDLNKIGISKLLGAGKVSSKMKVIVGSASGSAVEKLKAAGCELVL